MKTIQVYDPPMCCATGACGVDFDIGLARFAADLDWLQAQGNQVERYNLAQQPQAFLENADVHQLLATVGTDALPVIVIDGRVASRGQYPSRELLAAWAGVSSLPLVSSCCGGAAQDASHACCAEDETAKSAGAVGCGCHATCC